MQREARKFTTNLQSSLVSFTTHDNKEYMVAPCIALVPGVLNGELVSLDAVEKTYQQWNDKPVVVDHPYLPDGNSTSAGDPSLLSQVGIGRTYHADIDNDKLRVQVWIDIEKATRLGGDALKVLNAVKAGTPIEVSTGYWAVMREKKGTHNNKEYTAVTELIMPDHLAMLPNAVGACSWGDGCGIPRAMKANSMDEDTIIETITKTLKKYLPGMTQNMTATDKFQALSTLISQEMEAEGIDSWRWHVMDIEDNYVIIGMDKMLRRRPFIDTAGGNVQLSGEWEDVHQQTTFAPVTNEKACSCGGVTTMAEEESVPVEPDHTEQEPIRGPVPVPEELVPVEDQPVPGRSSPSEHEPERGPVPVPEEPVPVEEEPETEEEVTVDTLQDFLQEHGITQDDLVASVNARKEQRQAMVDIVKANSSLTDDHLRGVSDAVLTTMAAQFQANKATPGLEVNQSMYALRGAPAAEITPAQPHKLERRRPTLDKKTA